jgi:hypothetical protein
MVKKGSSKNNKKRALKQYTFNYRHHRFRVLADKILIFRVIKNLHGRFWGLAGAMGLSFGLAVCFLIRPEMLHMSTAFSDFGLDVRTAPYFSGSMFFAAYGLWRWRNYLKRTLRRTKPILALISITILGLIIVAIMPVSWQPWPAKLHYIGMAMTGISAAAAVIFDILLSKTPRENRANIIRIIKMVAFMLIVVGSWLTLGSSAWLGWFNISLPSEIMLMGGYFIWIILKTYQGEDPRSRLSRLLNRIILVD